MSLRRWLVTHLPPWLLPLNPWGPRGRPEMHEMHETLNRQQALSLQIDREQRTRALAALARWREAQDE